MSSACHGHAGADGLKPDEDGSEEQKALAQISSRFSEKKVSVFHSLSPWTPPASPCHVCAWSDCAALHLFGNKLRTAAQGSSSSDVQLILA